MNTPLTYLGEYYLKPFPLILDIPDFRFYGNAKLTDLVSSNFTAGPNLLVSPKLKDIFVQYSSPEKIQILDTKLFKRSKELDYHIIRFHYDLEAADMSKTTESRKQTLIFRQKTFLMQKKKGQKEKEVLSLSRYL